MGRVKRANHTRIPMSQYLTWRKGSTFRAYFDVTKGDVSGDEAARAAMKQRHFGEPVGDEVVVFGVEFFPAIDAAPAYFELVGQPGDIEDLPVGDYVADIRIEFDDGVFQSEPIRIQVMDRVTEDEP
jgi:hypothetical protein